MASTSYNTDSETIQLDIKPSQVAEKLLQLVGKPYTLKNYPMFRGIYDTPAQRRLMRSGRQVSKTVTIAGDILVNCAMTPHLPVIYANASKNQTSSFSKSKLGPLILFSPWIAKYLKETKRDAAANILHKQFSNASEIIMTYFSDSADRVRGLSGSRFYLDEAQDILYDAVIDAEECLSAAAAPHFTYAGTSKTAITTLEYMWSLSSKKEWIIKCTHCGSWNNPDVGNIQRKGLSCKKCMGIINPLNGQWHSFSEKPAAECYVDGFHIPQIILPLHCSSPDKWDMVIQKMETYPTHKFNNEVMGLPSGDGQNLITEELLQGICIPSLVMEDHKTPANSKNATHMVAGIDWGGYGGGGTSRTVLSIFAVHAMGPEFINVFGRIFLQGEPSAHVEQIAFYINRFGCSTCIGDHGGGSFAMSQLAPLVPNCRVIPAMYNDHARPFNWNAAAARCDVNRTSMIDGLILDMGNGLVRAMRWEDFQQFKEDFLAVKEDVINESSGKPRRVWRRYPTKPDDALHSMVFGWLAARMSIGMLNFSHVAQTNGDTDYDVLG